MKFIIVVNRGAVRGGGGAEGEMWFLPRGTLEPCISARPRRAPTFLRLKGQASGLN